MAQRLRKPPPPLCIRGMAGEKLRVGATLRIGDGEKLRMDGAVWTRDGIVVRLSRVAGGVPGTA